MIGPGWLPRPSASWRRRTLAYTRLRRRRAKKRATIAPPSHHEIVIFDRPPAEFPIASLRPNDPASHVRVLVADVRAWFAVRWTWLRPRTVPVAAAVLGATLMMLSASYLRHAHGPAPTQIIIISSTLAAP